MNEEFEVSVSKPELTFHSAHFIAHDGFREYLHGHNYQLSIRIMGRDRLGPDGYLIDFTDIKHESRRVCHSLHQRFLLPMQSPQLKIDQNEREITIECFDGSRFVFPKQDVVQLPIQHTSAEELALYIWGQLVR
jgi:6-pyruvoyltetrahydropterin/6-carboxytetrahydropterin synthase